MNIFRFRKQWKRRWRKWGRAIWTIGACALVALMAWLGVLLSESMERLMMNEPLSIETFGKLVEATSASDDYRFIGIDRNGNLSLFEGPPKKEKVIRTFFQLDVEMMESALPKEAIQQLRQGISVEDAEEYNSVLSTFSDYAVEGFQDEGPAKH